MKPVEIGQADSADDLLKKLMLEPDMNGVVLNGLVSKTCGDFDLLTWAQEFCSLGDVVKDQLCYFEGYEGIDGESFPEQLHRQLQGDFRDCGEAILEEMRDEPGASALAKSLASENSPAVKALFALLEEAMRLHEVCVEDSQDLLWKIKIEVNQNGACTKYHDDLVSVRFAMTLAGDGTVLADNKEVDWNFYESCGGLVTELADEDVSPDDARSAVQNWNERVSKGEVKTEPGDLAIMKGGKVIKRACLHRAPYSASEDAQPSRLLITLDHIPREELQLFIDMEFENNDDEEEEHTTQEQPQEQTQTLTQLLPTTVLSGFLGAGKTSLLSHVLQNQDGLRVAVIVNDMAEVNVDAMLVKSSSELLTGNDKMVEMQNGCICCTLREDLIENVNKLAAEKRFDYLLIESTGISEPMPVATTFVSEHEGKSLLGSVARLDTLVTVVDAANFLKDYDQGQKLNDRPALGAEDKDPRTIAQLLTDQVECANLIVLNKLDLVEECEAAHLEGILRKLNPKAKIIRSNFGNVDVKLLLNSGSFDMEEAEQMPGWYQELAGNHVPETLEYNISSFVFRSQRPFHPVRFDNLIDSGFEAVLRSKGLVWVAGIQEYGLIWQQAGKNLRIEDGANWLHGSTDISEWPSEVPAEWKTAPYGDRRQELVFIGTNLEEAKLRKQLEAALLTDDEFQMKSEEWKNWPNPFLDEKGDEKESKKRRIQGVAELEKESASSSMMQTN